MSKPPLDVQCPRCGSNTWRFGRDPQTGLQKHRRKGPACGYQFVPGRPLRPRKYPKVTCPKCGANMGIFKQLGDALRFRCNRHNRKDALRCKHKINIPLPGRDGFDMVTDPKSIRLIGGKLQPVFHWNRMRFSSHTVALVLYFHIFRAMPAPEVVNTLRDIYRVAISHDTVTRWGHKAAFLLADRLEKARGPEKKRGRKPRILADESQFKLRGKKRWFWLAYVPRYDFHLAYNLSARRDTQAARDLFAMAFANSPHMKNAEILTDGLWSYQSALGDLGVDPRKHIVYKSFFEKPNNNQIERQWSNFKVRSRPFRGFKSDVGLAAFIQNQTTYHNCFKPSPRLGGKTPAQAVGIRLPDAPSEWMRLARLLTPRT